MCYERSRDTTQEFYKDNVMVVWTENDRDSDPRNLKNRVVHLIFDLPSLYFICEGRNQTTRRCWFMVSDQPNIVVFK